jgi:hypothetical protein
MIRLPGDDAETNAELSREALLDSSLAFAGPRHRRKCDWKSARVTGNLFW